jgi:hypothetical protein
MCRVHEGDIMHVVHIVGRQTPNLVGPDHSTAYMKFKNTPMNDIQEVKAERVRCAAAPASCTACMCSWSHSKEYCSESVRDAVAEPS